MALSSKQLSISELPLLVKNLSTDSPDSSSGSTELLARKAIALKIAGGQGIDDITTLLMQQQNADGGWGSGGASFSSNPLDTAWALWTLAQNKQEGTVSGELARSYLINRLESDGGISGLTDTDRIQNTTLALLAMQSSQSDLGIATVVRNFAIWLQQRQGVNGAWADDVYLSALVCSTLSSVVSDTSLRLHCVNFLTSQQGVDGSWSSDPFLTAIALRTLSLFSGYTSVLASTPNPIVNNTVTPAPIGSPITVKGNIWSAPNVGIVGATVQVVGSSKIVTTGVDGSYRIENITQIPVTLRVSVTGYNTQLLSLQSSAQSSNVLQDFMLVPQSNSALAMSDITVTPETVSRGADVSSMLTITNVNTADSMVVVQLQVMNAQQKIVSRGNVYDETGNLIGQLPLAAGQQKTFRLAWNSAQYPAGTYTLNVRLIEAGSLSTDTPFGVVLLERRGSVTVTEQAHFTGTITTNPPILQAGTNTPVKLTAVIKKQFHS